MVEQDRQGAEADPAEDAEEDAQPDADAVDLCVAQIHSANSCDDFLTVSRVSQIDDKVAEQSAVVTADVEMVVLSPFAACSPVASSCTGACWDLKSGKAKPSPGSREGLSVAHRGRIEKAFAFEKTGEIRREIHGRRQFTESHLGGNLPC